MGVRVRLTGLDIAVGVDTIPRAGAGNGAGSLPGGALVGSTLQTSPPFDFGTGLPLWQVLVLATHTRRKRIGSRDIARRNIAKSLSWRDDIRSGRRSKPADTSGGDGVGVEASVDSGEKRQFCVNADAVFAWLAETTPRLLENEPHPV